MRDASLSASKFQDFPEDRVAQRRGRGPAPSPLQAPKKKRSALARVFAPHRVGAVLLLGIGALAFVGVPMNALFLQDGRHPAPLFSTHTLTPEKIEAAQTPTPPARPAAIEAARVEPEAVAPEPPRPAKIVPRADAAALKAEIMKSEAPTPSARSEKKPEKKAEKKPEKKREIANRDPIGSLLGGKPAPAAARPAAAQAAAQEPDGNVLLAQQALLKLGYVVKPDGKLSGGTRQAIEKFEQDNGLPAKGALSPKIVKLLGARAAQ